MAAYRKRLASGCSRCTWVGTGSDCDPKPVAFPSWDQAHNRLCIPSSDNSKGPIFFGDEPYNFLPGIDASQMLKYSPLIISPYEEYYIQVKSIKLNQKLVPVDRSLLTLSSSATGGTTFSTVDPYTRLEGSIFKSITSFFAQQLSGIPTVKPVAPFGLCHESKRFHPTKLGPGVPSIDLELRGEGAVWSIFGANSLVEAQPGVLCLAFVSGGSQYRAAITIGTYQLQDVLLQVDRAQSRLGFTGPLIGMRTTCGNFNFTTPGGKAPKLNNFEYSRSKATR